MAKNNTDFSLFDGIGNATSNPSGHIPIQTLPNSKKTKSWKKATVDALERIGLAQVQKNLVFREWKAMAEGRFTYLGTGVSDFQELPWFDKEVRKLRSEKNLDTYIKHFDFIGIITNAIAGIYSEIDDRYRVESIDEYSTNEYIRQKTEMLDSFAQSVFIQEVNKLLMMKGIDPNRQDFESEEEQEQYQQELQAKTQALTPPEIEEFLSKNFKVLATEWAQNVLTADKKRFYLADKDREDFVSYLLTGRFFRHYRVGYDSYYIDSWKAEETFFSEDADAEFPQDGEYVGNITEMSTSNILNKFGHIMTIRQQESIGNYWNQSKTDWDKQYGGTRLEGGKTVQPSEMAFPQPVQVPFHNYFDHKINTQLEDALNQPLGRTVISDEDGNEESFSSWIPREENELNSALSNHTQYLRDDINVRRDTVRVTQGYWRSSKRMAVLIYKNDFGTLSIELTTDDLLPGFLEENEIKVQRSVSIQDLQKALRTGDITDYEDTITYFYVPEVWKFVKLKGNGSTIKEDMYLDVRPLDYQIKGENSNIYDVKLPVTGIIGTGITPKLEPYQQLHNICMNQITELLEKELGVFFTFDITGLSDEYQDETTEDAIYRVRDNIKDTGLFGVDLSRQNTQGNQPNLFQRQEVVFATQVQYRWELAKQYKQEALNQVGITPQVLGQASGYETAEGVKQGAQASYTLINHLIDKMHTAKAKGMEIHLAIAQYCEKEGKEATILTRKGDGELRFLDIMKEDKEIYPLRNLSVMPETSSNERKKVEQIKQVVLNDNTIDRTYENIIEIMTNPVLVELQAAARKMEADKQKKIQEEREFEGSQLDKQIEAQQNQEKLKHERALEIENTRGEYKLKSERINALGRASDKNSDQRGIDEINRAAQEEIQNEQRSQEIGVKVQEIERKTTADREAKRIELMKIAQKSEELRLRDKAVSNALTQSIINKN